jgi:succinate-semialdehyde dehydrogenase/glutarate-semialdehyde dehydrogenase
MLQSVDPYKNELIQEYPEDSAAAVQEKLSASSSAQKRWMGTPLNERAALLRALAARLDERKDALSRLMSQEMGKPIAQGRAEIEKCAWLCRHYAEEGATYLEREVITIDGQETYIYNHPLGVVLGIMPWNYPFWQVFRFIVPSLMAGNGTVLKHASNVTGCALAIKTLLLEAGCPEGLFDVLLLPGKRVAEAIESEHVAAVTLTGSEPAGSAAAKKAGEQLKPSVLELGGNNALIVLADADVDNAVEAFVTGRFQNSGQSCIAAKRLLLDDRIADAFTTELIKKVEDLTFGNPLEEEHYVGPLARVDLAEELESQVQRSVRDGAEILVGGKREGAMYVPTILDQVKPGMAAFDEETFGPVAAITRFNGLDEAIDLSNQSRFGLGVSIFTSDQESVLAEVARFNEGAVFINDFVKSDPRVPFGGVKASGYGRELGKDGALAFVNRKTVVVK